MTIYIQQTAFKSFDFGKASQLDMPHAPRSAWHYHLLLQRSEQRGGRYEKKNRQNGNGNTGYYCMYICAVSVYMDDFDIV